MPKRTFIKIRQDILKSLGKKPKSITKIAKDTGMTWKTAKNHLIWLEKVEGKVKVIRRSKRKIIYKKIE